MRLLLAWSKHSLIAPGILTFEGFYRFLAKMAKKLTFDPFWPVLTSFDRSGLVWSGLAGSGRVWPGLVWVWLGLVWVWPGLDPGLLWPGLGLGLGLGLGQGSLWSPVKGSGLNFQ